MSKPYLPILLGTGREGRFSEKVARYILEKTKDFDLETEILDVRDFAAPFTVAYWVENEKGKRWKEIVNKANGFILVTPEYNHGYPGELKIWLDLAYEEYRGKPIVLCAVSMSGFGGARMVENLLPVLHELQFNLLHEKVYFSNARIDFANPDLKMLDEKYSKQVKNMLNSLFLAIK